MLLYWQEFPFTDAKNCASEVHRLCLSHNLIPALPKDVARFMLSINYLDISFNQLELLPEQVMSRRTPDSHMQSHGVVSTLSWDTLSCVSFQVVSVTVTVLILVMQRAVGVDRS